MSIPAWAGPLISTFVGLLAGAFGAYVGVRVSMEGLKTWRDIREGDIKALRRDVDTHNDDLLVHDYEIGTLMKDAGLERARRQMLR